MTWALEGAGAATGLPAFALRRTELSSAAIFSRTAHRTYKSCSVQQCVRQTPPQYAWYAGVGGMLPLLLRMLKSYAGSMLDGH